MWACKYIYSRVESGLCDSRLGLVNYNIRVSGLELMGLGLRVLVLIF